MRIGLQIPLEKGYSQMDWLRLMRSNPGLNGNGGKIRQDIPMEEVQQHNTKEDAWMVLNGKVIRLVDCMSHHVLCVSKSHCTYSRHSLPFAKHILLR